MPRLSTGVVFGDEFTRANTTNTLGTADVVGGAWKNVTTIGISSNGAVKTSGSGTARGFGLGSYGNTRIVSDGVTTSGSANLTSATAAWTTQDITRPVYGAGIPAGTTITSITSGTIAVMSANATASASGLTIVVNDVTLDTVFKTNPTTNLTDAGVALNSLDSWSTRGGQLYVSFRKISGQNSVRVLHRANTSGSDTALTTNSSAGWADNTTYDIRVLRVGKTIDVQRRVSGVGSFASILSGGVPYTIADSVLNTLGTDVGISFTNTDTGSRFEDFFAIDPYYVPPTPNPTAMRLQYHRGSKFSLARTYEEHKDTLALLTVGGCGPEVDLRRPSDWATTGKSFLLHDTTFNPASPNGTTGTATTANTATYVAAQIEELQAYLDGCIPYGYDSIIIQFEIDAQSEMVDPINVILAHSLALNVVLATSATAGATPRMDRMRAAGWPYRIQCYGLDTMNYSTLLSDLLTYNVSILYLALGDAGYDANRSLISTMHSDGFLVGASTITNGKFALAESDAVDYVLTDYSDEFIATYTPPALVPMATFNTRAPARVVNSPTLIGQVTPNSRTGAEVVTSPTVVATGSANVTPNSRTSSSVTTSPSLIDLNIPSVVPDSRDSARVVTSPTLAATGIVNVTPNSRSSAKVATSPSLVEVGSPAATTTMWDGANEVSVEITLWSGGAEVAVSYEVVP